MYPAPPVFTSDFKKLPQLIPDGFWVNQSGEFVTLDNLYGSHEDIIDRLASDMPNGKKLCQYYKSYYLFAYNILKLVRVACETLSGKCTLFYQFPDKSKISNKAMGTIQDIAMMYDCTVEYDGSSLDP